MSTACFLSNPKHHCTSLLLYKTTHITISRNSREAIPTIYQFCTKNKQRPKHKQSCEHTLDQKKQQLSVSRKWKAFVETVSQGNGISNNFKLEGYHAKASHTLMLQNFHNLNINTIIHTPFSLPNMFFQNNIYLFYSGINMLFRKNIFIIIKHTLTNLRVAICNY